MRDLIVNKTGWFFLGWLGAVVLGTGLGALAISVGTPLMVVIYSELALQVCLALAIAIGVPDRVGGLAAAAMTMVVPFGAFVGWAEVTLSRATTNAALVAAVGATLVSIAGWRALAPRERLARASEVPA